MRVEEVAVAWSRMAIGSRACPAPEHHLSDHEFAVVLTHRAGRRCEGWVGSVGARGPLPEVRVDLLESVWPARHGVLPLRLGGQAPSGPGRVSGGLVITHLSD